MGIGEGPPGRQRQRRSAVVEEADLNIVQGGREETGEKGSDRQGVMTLYVSVQYSSPSRLLSSVLLGEFIKMSSAPASRRHRGAGRALVPCAIGFVSIVSKAHFSIGTECHDCNSSRDSHEHT